MARKPDVVCAGQCGRLLWRGRGSRDQPMCRECRAKARDRVCEWCSEVFRIPSLGQSAYRGRFCSRACNTASRRKWPNQAEKERAKNRTRRARLRGVESEPYTLIEIAERDGFVCQLCRGPVDMTLSGRMKWGPTIDHRIALANGGDDTRSNAQLAHRVCNLSKGAKILATA
jgi:5-methylcytosine-specific restriction endonuclease McrA